MAFVQLKGKVAMTNFIALVMVVLLIAMNGKYATAQDADPPISPPPVSGRDNSAAASSAPIALLTMAFLSFLVGALLN